MPSLRFSSERNTCIATYSPMTGATQRRSSFSTTISEVRQAQLRLPKQPPRLGESPILIPQGELRLPSGHRYAQ